MKKFKHIIESCYLCIRFPFLYPRNRYSGLHYTNWRFCNYTNNLHKSTNKKVKIWWKICNGINETLLQWIHIIPTYTELDAMPNGWRKSFGIQICKEIKDALVSYNKYSLYNYRIMQIKEKYGELRWYDYGGNKDTEKIIQKYEYLSRYICIDCGKPAYGISQGWIEPYCKNCAEIHHIDINNSNLFSTYGTKENSWFGYIYF